MSKMSQESQVNLNFADYDKLGLRLSAISISPQSEERQFWPVGCPWAGCKIGRHQNLLTSPHFQKSDSVLQLKTNVIHIIIINSKVLQLYMTDYFF